jgi:FG-GAP-like repeat
MKLTLKFMSLAVISTVLVSDAVAATYAAYDDRELIRRSHAVVVAQALNSWSGVANGTIVTFTNFSIEETIKGRLRSSVTVREPGGTSGNRTFLVPGAPRFRDGERVLLFLRELPGGGWAVTDLALGRFTFVNDIRGRRLLVRDETEFVAFDRTGKAHVEKHRAAEDFVQFVRAESGGRPATMNYFVEDRGEIEFDKFMAQSDEAIVIAPHAFTANSYTMVLSGSTGGRWKQFDSAQYVPWFASSLLTNAPNNGVNAVNAAFARWNDEPGSSIDFRYAGFDSRRTEGLYGNADNDASIGEPDATNTFYFERDLTSIGVSRFTCTSNSWGGTVGLGGINATAGTHEHPNRELFYTIGEADVDFNQGINNCPNFFNSANFIDSAAHEFGHALGFRHSNHTRDANANVSCAGVAGLECTTDAIMNSSITTGGAGLRQWDVNAARTVYPGASAPQPSTAEEPPSHDLRDFNGDGVTDIFWRNPSTGEDTLWFLGRTSSFSIIGGGNIGAIPSPWRAYVGDFNGDNRSDVLWRNPSTGENTIWLLNGRTVLGGGNIPPTAGPWIPIIGDYNRDGRADIFWRNTSTGEHGMWFLNGTSIIGGGTPGTIPPPWTPYVGDFDGNGNTDIFWRNTSTGENTLWLLTGTSSFAVGGGGNIGTIPPPWVPRTGDFNGDTRSDILWRNPTTGENTLWFLNGRTVIGGGNIPPVAGPWIAIPGDYNGDGRWDIKWRNTSTGDHGMWFLNGTAIIGGGTPGTIPPPWISVH